MVRHRNLDGITVWHGRERVCLTDLPWVDAYPHITEMLLRSSDPMFSYFGLLEHLHTRLREVGEKYDISHPA